MTSRRRPIRSAISKPPKPTGKVFLGEEDKRLLRKISKHIVNKLGLGGSRSIKS